MVHLQQQRLRRDRVPPMNDSRSLHELAQTALLAAWSRRAAFACHTQSDHSVSHRQQMVSGTLPQDSAGAGTRKTEELGSASSWKLGFGRDMCKAVLLIHAPKRKYGAL